MTEEEAAAGADDVDEGADDDEEVTWPVPGPASPRQALFAIAFLCFLCLVIGFVLGRTF